ncbi:bifunctional 4-hydroxy-3-methylbut-2-enyl diphosphate reductase/30S ribosomal protein S1 [Thermincola ferriacetica]
MEFILAPKAGFCFGVKRALDITLKTAKEHAGPIYTLGPLIHNPQVVQQLEQRGIKVAEDLSDIHEGTLVIRSHGVAPDVLEEAASKGLQVIDATCPFVKKAQELAKKMQAEGRLVVVIGDKKHPEVAGIIGWTGNRGVVVENPEEVEKIETGSPIGVVCQTTQPEQNFEETVRILQNKGTDIVAHNTICHATRERQDSAINVAESVDVMIVIGGRNSANTKKLARLCEETGTPTYHIETAAELQQDWFKEAKKVGLTAGASTPGWIIEEVKRKMEEMTNRDEGMNMEKALQFKAFHPGDMVTGTVVQVNDDEVMVDVGGKSEGVIPLRESSCCNHNNLKELFTVGDQVKVVVLKAQDDEGKIILSKRKADAELTWGCLEEAFDSGTPVEGTVREVVKGGLLLDLGVQGFMPASLVERSYVEDLNQYLGQKLKAKIIELRRDARKVVLSRKAILEEEAQAKKAETLRNLQSGQVVKGTVKRLTDFGAFVDIGGIDGLLHVSEMAWYRVGHPSEVVKEGDQIEVFILDVDKNTEKVSLSLKKVLPNPWDTVAEKYPVGSIVEGKVVRLAPFGAFVELEPGVDGLVHISQLANRRVANCSEVVSAGDMVKAKVIEVDAEKKRISLSMKEVEENNEACEIKEMLQNQDNEPGPTLGDVFGGLFEKEYKKEDEVEPANE